MALSTRVFVSNTNDLHNARYCAGMGVEMIGVNPKQVSLETLNEWRGWLSGLSYVLEGSENSPLLIEEYQPDFLCWNAENPLPNDRTLQQLPCILKVNDLLPYSEIETTLNHFGGTLEAVWLNLSNNSSITSDKSNIIELAKQFPVMLGGNITASTIKELLETIPLEGIILEAGEEIITGVNNFDALADILEELDTDEFL